MAAADIEIVNQKSVLDIEAVARGRIAMRDQDALGAGVTDLDMGLDGVAAAAHIGGNVGRHMAHAGVKDEMVARALKPRSVLRKARREAIVERQHMVSLGLAPPQFCYFGEAVGVLRREIVDFGKIHIEMKQLPFVVLKRRARWVKGDRLPSPVPKAAMSEHFEILRRRL